MAAVDVATKKKCEFWDKCYRKNKQHKEEYLHPGDVEETKKAAQDKPRLVHDISVNDDDDDQRPTASASTAPKTAAGAKGKLDEDSADDTGSSSTTTSASTSSTAPSPSKKIKVEDTDEEKIAVDYTKKKAATTTATSVTPTAAITTQATATAATATAGGAASTTASTTAAPTVQYKSKKEKCKYWEKCYQTNKTHRDEFYHPGDDVPAADTKENKTRGQTNSPLNQLDDGGSVQFDSGYTLKRDGDNYSCSCKGFLAQRAPINERTCKHLKEYLGEQFEKKRIEKNTKPKKVNVNLLLAHKYDEKTTDPKGWWISEKLDGVRAFWNGRCFYSRLGNAFYAPEWFTKDLPKDIHLDGELFGGRGQFQSTVSIVKTAESPKWKDIKYYVFDSPHMGRETFEKRMNTIKEYFEETQPEYAVFVEQTKCKSKEHLDQKLTRVLNLGGEGLMIRQPKSVYEPTRSRTLLKIKKFYDAEATVIGHEQGKGVNQNRCGALRCRMACGKEFSVGSGMTDKNRNNPPKIGSIITYRFQELSKSGSPRFPTFVGIRLDKTEPEDAEIRPVLDEEDA